MNKWNDAQQSVLDSLEENKNILVSAAAGSGKTAVLVERIIRTVLQEKAEIDEILVCTFTKAAAAQMKEKIIKALEKEASQSPDGSMARQLMKAETADIMTIDSFCNKIVKENFNLAGMDPAFEICDSEEIALLKEDILDQVMDEHYKNDKEFNLLASFLISRSINDENIRNIILDLHKISESYAIPEKWLQSVASEYEDMESGKEVSWITEYIKYLKTVLMGYSNYLKQRADFFLQDISGINQNTAEKIYDVYSADSIKLRNISEKDSLKDMIIEAESEKWKNFPKKPMQEIYGEDYVKKLSSERDDIKSLVKSILTTQQLKDECQKNEGFIRSLVNVTLDFREALQKEKDRNRKYEFSDISHAAFNILYNVEEDRPSAVGIRMSEIYKYIYIDEYQDSNDLQENILNAVARFDENGNINNVFMVGDIKQSIYRFRLARPALFTEKANRYGNDVAGKLITLNMNYRSRRSVLEATNHIFREVMSRDFGGVDYDESAALHVPSEESYLTNYPDALQGENVSGIPELIMVDQNIIEDSEEPDLSEEELEATIIGRKILEIVNGSSDGKIKPLFIRNENFNKDRPVSENNPVYRKAGFGDIVILQRKVNGTGNMTRIYEQMGIPVTLEDGKGYFDAMEVVTVLSVLRVIDNIQQDIPLASVLLSPIGGFSDDDLALITSLSDDRYSSLADRISAFEESDVEKSLAFKCKRIRELIRDWSEIKPFISISRLIDRVMKDTGYLEYVAAMSDGKRRVANIKMLKVRADHFESVRTGGLLDYLRYIDKCKIHNIDYGEASSGDNRSDTVRVMSIHKSKGLEFPVVIAARLGKGFILKDTQGDVVVTSDYGTALTRFTLLDNGVKLKEKSLKKSVCKLLNDKDVKEEEARLLYVAMTRAKEKLIMTGSFKDEVPATPMLAKSMLDYVRYSININDPTGVIEVKQVTKYDAAGDFEKIYKKRSYDYSKDIENVFADIEKAAENISLENNPYDNIYPYEIMTQSKAKLSVSEIKHSEMEKNVLINPDEETELTVSESYEGEVTVSEQDSSEMEENQEELKVLEEMRVRAATRGTVIHSLFENLNYGAVSSKKELAEEFRRILSNGSYSEEERGLINTERLAVFYSGKEDSLFSRMKTAFLSGKLMREQQFIAGLTNNEIPGREETECDDVTVIQGIIDAFFYEGDDDHIILVDYKTDNVKDGKELLGRYASQMYLYGLVLEKLTGHVVKDVILYSTRFGEVHYPDWRTYNSVTNKQ